MSVPLFQVDAFSEHPFAGNPAAVCLLETSAEATWMQSVASEMNLSETAFLVPREGGDGWNLRWFTPKAEVDLCGHATLASAHVLWEAGLLGETTPARFHTRSGELVAERRDDGRIAMDFPAYGVEPAPGVAAEAGRALGAEPVFVGRSRFDLLVELASAAAISALEPDGGRIAALDARGVIVTAAGDGRGIDLVSRFFAPRVGVPEDPVTGSAHSVLGPFWADRLGRRELVARQLSPRGGELHLRLEPGGRGGRIEIAGRAVTVLAGELRA